MAISNHATFRAGSVAPWLTSKATWASEPMDDAGATDLLLQSASVEWIELLLCVDQLTASACARHIVTDRLSRDPAAQVLGPPSRHARRELDGHRERARLNATPQGGPGNGHEDQHLRLTKETRFRYGWRWGLGCEGCRRNGG